MSRCLVSCVIFIALFVCVVLLLTIPAPLHAGATEGKSIVRYFYIHPANGDDTNGGSVDRPWRSFANIISYYKPEYRPTGWVELKPGDCIYLMDGVYSEILHPGEWKKGPGGGGSFVAYFRGRRGDAGKRFQLKAYPGHKPVIDPQGKGIGISIFQSSHWDVAGIEVKNAYQRGVSLNESKEVTLHDVGIHDTDGVDNNNIAGLYITDCWNVEVYDCVFNDNYDRTCADTNGRSTENSCNVVIFGGMQGGNITIHDCFIYNSSTAFYKDGFSIKAGGGIKYKHASRIPDAYFRVHHNVFKNLSFFAFGSGTANTHFHDNVIAGPAGISSRDFGGVTHQANQVFENNLLYRTWGLAMNPTIRWRNDKFPDDPKNIVFTNNVVYDTAKSWSKERGIIMVGTYMSDEVYDAVAGELHFTRNSYYNPDMPVQFNLAAGFNYKEGYASGGVYALKEWQNTFGYDGDSVEDDTLKLDWRYADRPNWTLLEPVYGQNNKLEIELLVKTGHYEQALKMLKRLPPKEDLYGCMCNDAPHQHRSAWRKLLDEELVMLAKTSDVCPSAGIPYAIGEIGDPRAIEDLQKARQAFLHTNTHFETSVLFARAKCGDETAAAGLYKNRTGNLLHHRHINMLLEKATGVSFGRIRTEDAAAAIFRKWLQYIDTADAVNPATR